MLAGMFVSGIVFTIGSAMAGWAAGSVVDAAVKAASHEAAHAGTR